MRKFLALMAICLFAPVHASTVLYNNQTVEVKQVLPDPNDLWVAPHDLTRVNGFELKPEGACLDEICVPVKQDEDSDIFITREEKKWFNVAELARKLNQPFVHDGDVWSFGAIPVVRQSFTRQHMAPGFSISDRQGNPVSLSDYKDMKVLLLTWASW